MPIFKRRSKPAPKAEDGSITESMVVGPSYAIQPEPATAPEMEPVMKLMVFSKATLHVKGENYSPIQQTMLKNDIIVTLCRQSGLTYCGQLELADVLNTVADINSITLLPAVSIVNYSTKFEYNKTFYMNMRCCPISEAMNMTNMSVVIEHTKMKLKLGVTPEYLRTTRRSQELKELYMFEREVSFSGNLCARPYNSAICPQYESPEYNMNPCSTTVRDVLTIDEINSRYV